MKFDEIEFQFLIAANVTTNLEEGIYSLKIKLQDEKTETESETVIYLNILPIDEQIETEPEVIPDDSLKEEKEEGELPKKTDPVFEL